VFCVARSCETDPYGQETFRFSTLCGLPRVYIPVNIPVSPPHPGKQSGRF